MGLGVLWPETYMTHVVVHSDAIMATDSFPVTLFCTSGRFE